MLTAKLNRPGSLIVVFETHARLVTENGSIGQEDGVLVVNRVKAAAFETFGIAHIKQMIISGTPINRTRRHQLIGVSLLIKFMRIRIKRCTH